MARASGRAALLTCHSCKRSWRGVVWTSDYDMRQLHTFSGDPDQPCERCSILTTEPSACRFAPEACTCGSSHVQAFFDSLSNLMRGRTAQVRAEQRTVFYRMPDGTISIPESRDLSDPIAQFAASQGGIRDEAYHISDLRRIHAEQRVPRNAWDNDFDDFTDRALFLDYDHQTIVGSRDHYIHKIQQEREDSGRREALEMSERGFQSELGNVRVIFGGQYYEEVRRRNGR